MWDVFISHASEDKEDFVRPLAEALQKEGVKVWYDEYELTLGDSLRRNIDEGLKNSTYGIVVLSNHFFSKEWPQDELDGLFERERDGKKVILPIWHDLTASEVRHYSPILAGRLAANSKNGILKTVKMIMDVLGDSASPEPNHHISTDKEIIVTAEKESFVIGSSIKVQAYSVNCGDNLHFIVFGPGKYSKGVEVAQPSVSSSNQCSYEWKPDSSILPGRYTVTVYDSEKKIYDTVLVKAKKGSLTIYYEGTGSYYIGQLIKLAGTYDAGKKIYLTLKGPDALQQERKLDQLNIISEKDNENSFVTADVGEDTFWSYKWDTRKIGKQLEEGKYRIYAINSPVTSDYLSTNSIYSYASGSVIMRLPNKNAMVSQSIFAQGDPIIIKGTSEGIGYHELIIWIFGEKDTIVDKINVDHDLSYIYEIPRIISKKLEPGQYFAVIQHPMFDEEFSVYFDDHKKYALSDIPNKETKLFSITGDENPKGMEAAHLLVSAINNSEIDDTYTKVTFLIEQPMIQFDPSIDIKKGETPILRAKTNLGVDNEILIELFDSRYLRDAALETRSIPIIKRIEYVIKGDGAENEILFEIGQFNLTSGNYLIRASAMNIDVNTTVSLKIR